MKKAKAKYRVVSYLMVYGAHPKYVWAKDAIRARARHSLTLTSTYQLYPQILLLKQTVPNMGAKFLIVDCRDRSMIMRDHIELSELPHWRFMSIDVAIFWSMAAGDMLGVTVVSGGNHAVL